MNNNSAKPFLPWLGGKCRLAKHILPLFPEHTLYVEPFCGGAALFFMKKPSCAEIINDINSDIVNLYRVVKYHQEEFSRQFQWMLASREMWNEVINQHTEYMTDIQRAVRFFFIQKCAYGGRAYSRAFGVKTHRPQIIPGNTEQLLQEARDRLARATIEHLDWEVCIARYDRPTTLFYCDPPYWLDGGYGIDFSFCNYERMAELARTIKGKMIISLNDTQEMRRLFEGMNIHHVAHRYTVPRGKTSSVSELIICNF
ncbi:DNA adenine methylase [Escherichia coli]|nr:DNA adenine methylase [Escherichia coli]EER3606066.1 DNA adenine methylase [Escherichia coli]EEU3763738.1 DNA adenine methylase [Escherichia coli]